MKMLGKILILLFIFLSCSFEPKGSAATEPNGIAQNKSIAHQQKLKRKAKEALQFCKQKKYNTSFCILIDMQIHSGLKRFYVWDFNRDTIRFSYLVGHGCGMHNWASDESKTSPQFSNVDGSHCSSLGKYKIGQRAHSDWGVGIKYFLHGLEPSNSNAFKRLIVFHAWDVVNEEETYPYGTPEGWGCPTISNKSFLQIDPLLQKSDAPVLMWIYI